jgi:hypothetical protein
MVSGEHEVAYLHVPTEIVREVEVVRNECQLEAVRMGSDEVEAC